MKGWYVRFGDARVKDVPSASEQSITEKTEIDTTIKTIKLQYATS